LEEKELIEPKCVKRYSEKYAQNVEAILDMQLVKTPPNCMDKLCDILQTKQQDHIADRLLTGKDYGLVPRKNIRITCTRV